ncbi:MAG: DUF1294 domain-containing protein [Erysipelotrichaceae bacterium]|nr:DUF1294 domain-containing protein [Erysipelotrichaceae bacterium]
MLKNLPAILFLLNLFSFFLYGFDKYRARNESWRISEKMLLTAAVFGIAGALLGSRLFRHKTRKPLFRILLPLIFLAEATVAIYLYLRFSGRI